MVNAILKLDEKTDLIIERAENAAIRAEEAARQAGKVRDYLALLGVAAPGAILTGWLANQITQPFAPTPTAGPGMSQAQPTLDPNAVFGLVKSLVDAEIQLFTQGLISATQLEARIATLVASGLYTTANDVRNIVNGILSTIPPVVTLGIQDVDNEISRLTPVLVNPIVNAVNSAISLINKIPGVNIPTVATIGSITPPVSAPSGYNIIAGPYPTQPTISAGQTAVQLSDGNWYIVVPTTPSGYGGGQART